MRKQKKISRQIEKHKFIHSHSKKKSTKEAANIGKAKLFT